MTISNKSWFRQNTSLTKLLISHSLTSWIQWLSNTCPLLSRMGGNPAIKVRLMSDTSTCCYSACPWGQGRNHGWKVEGDQGLGPNTGALASRAQSKAGLGVGCGRGSPPPAVRFQEYHPRKIFENSDAKSCILVTTCCEISCFLKTTAKKLGDNTLLVAPNLKVGGNQSPPVPTVVAPMHGVTYVCAFCSSTGNNKLHEVLKLRRNTFNSSYWKLKVNFSTLTQCEYNCFYSMT